MKLGRPLALVLVLGLGLRLAGLHFGLPHAYHQDEPIVVNHAMAVGVDGWNTGTYLPPQFAAYFLFVVYGAYFMSGTVLGLFENKDSFALQFLSDPTMFYLLGRFFLGVLFGSAAIVVVYRLARRYFSRQTGIWAALFLAASPASVIHSHYIYMDMALAFAVTLVFYFLTIWRETPSVRNMLAAGAAFGWAVSVKYTAVYFAPAFALALFLAPKKRVSWPAAARQTAAAAVVSVVVYALVSPYSFLDWANFTSQVAHQSGARGYQGALHHLEYSLLNGTGFLFLALALVGMVWGCRRFGPRAIVIAVPMVIYYGVNVFFSQTYLRYMMPLVPLLCFFAAQGVEAVAWAFKRQAAAWVTVAVTAAQLLAPSVYFDWLLYQPDTRTECMAWFDAHTPDRSKVLLDNAFFAPRLSQTREQLEEKYARLGDADGSRRRRLDLLVELADQKKTYAVHYTLRPGEDAASSFLMRHPLIEPSREALAGAGIEYVVLNYSDPTAELHALRARMGAEMELVASFSPFADRLQRQPKDPFGLTGPPDSQADLFSRRKMGPYLEVYKMVGTAS